MKEERNISQSDINPAEVDSELARFAAAIHKTRENIHSLYESTKDKLDNEKAEIFAAHLSVLEDPSVEDSVHNKITNGLLNAEHALQQTLVEIEAMFAQLNDEYLQERITDIKDVGDQILANLLGVTSTYLSNLPYDCIIVSEDLTPSETMSMDFSKTLGFITEQGGRTSHTAIISRGLEIPAIVGVGTILDEVTTDDIVILDATTGEILINPSDTEIKSYKKKQQEFLAHKEMLGKIKGLPACTTDGKTFELYANIGNPADVDGTLNYGAEGIGLCRTEFIYMDNTHFPTEDEQFESYKAIAIKMGKNPVIIRTLDIGGDKNLPYYEFEREENPFLGWRAIRICLEKTDVFKTQLRAILRASVFGKLKIMYPMIISKEELMDANRILLKCKNELKAEGKSFDENIEVGIMVETPASVIMAEVLAKYVDFFSIGTNDLCQYTLAVDRGNTRISQKYNPFHPAVLRSIKKVIDASHKEGKLTGMCGEFAGDEKATKILVGFGLDEFSMTASSVPKIKDIIRKTDSKEAKELARRVLCAESITDVKVLLK